jgi:hypothetical protein
MARQKGIVKFQGEMGGISFYKSQQDGFLAREKGGVDGNRIKNDPSYARTRENLAEFARAGEAAKLLRTSLRALLVDIADSRMASRLTREMMKVIKADATSIRGQRNVIDGEAELLKDFEFNLDAQLGSTFSVLYTSIIDRGAGNLTVDVPDFIPGKMIGAPQGATHARLISAGVEIDFEAGSYVVNTSATPEIVLGPQNEGPVTLANAVTPASTHPLFLALGIEFYQEVNGLFYPLNNGFYNALALVAVDGGV